MLSRAILAVIIIGFIIAILIALIFYFIPNLFTVITGTANSGQQISLFGSVTTLIGIGYGMYKTVLEWRKSIGIPTLEYDGLARYDYFQIYQQMGHPRGTLFYLKIKKTKGEKNPKCRGFMNIKNTPIFESPLQWHLNNNPEEIIQDSKYLCLFSIDLIRKNGVISDLSGMFFYNSSKMSNLPLGGLWRDYKDKIVQVKIESVDAKTPKDPFKDTIENIFKKSKPMGSEVP